MRFYAVFPCMLLLGCASPDPASPKSPADQQQMALQAEVETCRANWIRYFNNISYDTKTFPAHIEVLYQCLETADYVRFSEKAIQFLADPNQGSLAPFRLEVEYVLWTAVKFYIDQFERDPGNPTTRERLEVSWRRLASFTDRHLFSELAVLRAKELTAGSYDIGGEKAGLIPLGEKSWIFDAPITAPNSYDLGDFSAGYRSDVNLLRRNSGLLALQTVECVFTVGYLCPVKFDDDVFIERLRWFHPRFSVSNEAGNPVPLPELKAFFAKRDPATITFH